MTSVSTGGADKSDIRSMHLCGGEDPDAYKAMTIAKGGRN
jgi:hypothetical protein